MNHFQKDVVNFGKGYRDQTTRRMIVEQHIKACMILDCKSYVQIWIDENTVNKSNEEDGKASDPSRDEAINIKTGLSNSSVYISWRNKLDNVCLSLLLIDILSV